MLVVPKRLRPRIPASFLFHEDEVGYFFLENWVFFRYNHTAWRGVRVAEGARLESVCAGNRTEGSNPSLSAITKARTICPGFSNDVTG